VNLADASGVAFVIRLPLANDGDNYIHRQEPILTAER
jgi:hypothetical protein